MSRAPRSVTKRQRHKKWLKRAKGFRGSRRTVFKRAKEAVLKSGQHAYRDRRKKKITQRQSWQIRINAAARVRGTTYSRLIHGLRVSRITLDRKILAQLAVSRPDLFDAIVAKTKP
ncbi:MAG: 50S ribosomal protein L20 [Candidatus Andersenbacteria bacterium]|nr:50S ribosomal protein L20 [Candidatus Andersenbacteria bacterium]